MVNVVSHIYGILTYDPNAISVPAPFHRHRLRDKNLTNLRLILRCGS